MQVTSERHNQERGPAKQKAVDHNCEDGPAHRSLCIPTKTATRELRIEMGTPTAAAKNSPMNPPSMMSPMSKITRSGIKLKCGTDLRFVSAWITVATQNHRTPIAPTKTAQSHQNGRCRIQYIRRIATGALRPSKNVNAGCGPTVPPPSIITERAHATDHQVNPTAKAI